MAELCAAHALVAEARVESLIPFVGPSFTATDVVWRLTSVLKGTETSTAIVVALIDVNLQRVAPVPGQRYLLFANSFSSNLPERPGAARYFLGASLAVDEGRIGPVNGFSAGQLTPALQTRISAMTPEQVRAEVAANSRMRQIRLQAGVQSGAPLLNSVWGAPLSLLNDLSGARLVFTADSAPLPGPQRRAASPLYGLLFTSPEEFVLEEGTYRVSLEGVPFGYEARAAMFDRGVGLTRPVDLQRDFLKVDSQRNPIDLFVSLVPDPAAQGVTVRGRLSGLPAGATPSPMWVSLLSDGAVPNRAGIVAAGADGRFEFSKVPPGRYFARVSQSALTARDRWAASTGTVVVGNSDTSVELPLAVRGIRVDIKVSVTGRDGRSVSFLPDNFFVTFARASLLVERTSGEGGLSATLAPGDYTVAPGVLPAGFTLKSIRSGATDLTVRPLSVGNAPVLPLGNAGLPPAPPIEVVLQYEF
jgi:hypothetical protein